MKAKIDTNIVVFSPKKHNIQFCNVELQQIVLDLRALAHKERQQIVGLLKVEGQLSVTQIYLRLRIDQSVTSQHLAMLRRTQIVSQARSGKIVNYSLNMQKLDTVKQLLSTLNSTL
jgi:DNA-binding transcriptional ArsR family regulator